jgi:hypothetical protein
LPADVCPKRRLQAKSSPAAVAEQEAGASSSSVRPAERAPETPAEELLEDEDPQGEPGMDLWELVAEDVDWKTTPESTMLEILPKRQ